MKIKYIAWKNVNISEVNRLVYGIKGEGLHNVSDQAIQNFNLIGENPGLWTGFTLGASIPRKKEVERKNRANGTSLPTTFDIKLENSVNPLRLWEDKNDARRNPIKINHEIWDRKSGHEKAIIEVWYLGYMRLLKKLLMALIDIDGVTNPNEKELLEFVESRLADTDCIRTDILKWIYETQDGFADLELNTSFLGNDSTRRVKNVVERNFYMVIKYDDNGIEKNMALMANADDSSLHPRIREILNSNSKGGEYVDIDISIALMDEGVDRYLNALYKHKNIILYGPPGTGKTHLMRRIMDSFKCNVLFNDQDTEAPFKIIGGDVAVKWCTFHPNYSYERFVAGITPKIINKQLTYDNKVGPFFIQSINAERGNKSLLVIDEINRAKTDDVFGPTIAILKKDSQESIKFTQPIVYNNESIEKLNSSENLFVIGTMNSLDKSVAPISIELKSRFVIVEIKPNVDVLRQHLAKNSTIDDKIVQFCCDLMEGLNKRIYDFCGKEYEFGQGYFWPLVEAKDSHLLVLAEIIINKIWPHIKDVVPLNCLEEFFTKANLGLLYNENDYGFDFADVSSLSYKDFVNSFAKVIGSSYKCIDNIGHVFIEGDFNSYDNNKIEGIKDKLFRYKNIIISGCSGVGKTYIADKIAEDPYFVKVLKMYWHGSTEYADVIEGIKCILKGTDLDYSVVPGTVMQLADAEPIGPKLMIIEGFNKSNVAENFGELITLLEPDKRNLKVEGMEKPLTIPKDMYFLCINNLSVAMNNKLDSAMKRRFVIVDLCPDYRLLSLYFGVDINNALNEESFDNLGNPNIIKKLAIVLLQRINEAIIKCLGPEYQIGHAVLWSLKEQCSLNELIEILDTRIIPQIEEYCYDEGVAEMIFGKGSPLLIKHSYGVEVCKLSTMAEGQIAIALKEILRYENNGCL